MLAAGLFGSAASDETGHGWRQDGSYGREALVIAREYGIPDVLGTGVATKRIQFSQTIRVDGDVGMVTLLDGVVK